MNIEYNDPTNDHQADAQDQGAPADYEAGWDAAADMLEGYIEETCLEGRSDLFAKGYTDCIVRDKRANEVPCRACGNKVDKRDAFEGYSMGLPCGLFCDEKCFDKSGYRKVDASAFDPSYAGERYDDDY